MGAPGPRCLPCPAGDASGVYFTTPHFDGFPAVLVQLERIDSAELEELVVEAWLARAPRRLARAYLDALG